MSTDQVPLEYTHPHKSRGTLGTLTLVNTTARPLAARLTAFPTLGRVSLPTHTGSDVSEAYTRSASAYVPKLTIPTTNATNEALQAGGTRKKRDRINRRWKPGAKGERTEYRDQQREQQEQRRQEREQQQGTRTLSKTRPILSPSALSENARQAGGGYAVDRRERTHDAHDVEPYQEPSAPQAPLRALDPCPYSSTARTRRRVKGPTVEGSGASIPPSNPLVSRGSVPERPAREHLGHEPAGAYGRLSAAQGGGAKTGLARLLGRVALAPFSFSPRQQFGGFAS